uniref:Uncharacterized protein LOC114326564 isoform X1 n=1 Tax=Diabrotica virgifera virgifera TaxID=50390 RepID=A0A6P7F500_DIAVI
MEVLIKDKFYRYKCSECSKQFSGLANFNAHKKIHTTPKIVSHRKPKQLKCPLCKYEDIKSKLIHHFGEKHEVVVKAENMQFNSLEEFHFWKLEEEKTTRSFFVKNRSSSNVSNGTKTIYNCHRSGKYIAKGNNKRHLKYKGSNKINAFCPANITVIQEANICKVDYVKMHIGHQNNLGHLFLSQEKKRELASKIAAKIPLAAILDEIRDSMTSANFSRIHLLTKKDLHNIEQTYNLNATPVRHRNDAISVQAWVNELQKSNSVLFYKPQDDLSEEHACLKREDFVLILMTEGQKEMLDKFGGDCICVDGTHGITSYGFELVTLLVLDDMREGFPCAFMISNRTDEDVMCILFSCIRKSLQSKISPKVFMSDMAESFFNAWIKIMSPPEYRLYCCWHVDRAWRKNLSKISAKDMQVVVYQQLRTLLQETDVKAFSLMLETFLKSLYENEATLEFANYFKIHYANKVDSWAYSYRLNSGLNTNMHLERMHHTIKYIYLKGKHNKRLDRAISALLKFVRDKLFDQLITIHKGKLCTKLRELRSRHKSSQELDHNLVIKMDTVWQVPSSTTQEIYLVEQRKVDCACKIVCLECDACFHQYSCTCIDSSVRYNMCKHIHLVCRYEQHLPGEKNAESLITETDSDQDGNALIIQECTSENKIQDLVKVLSSKETEDGDNDAKLDKEKLNLKNWIWDQIDKISSMTELNEIKRLTAPIEAVLNAVKEGSTSIKIPEENIKIPHNKNIVKQRRLFSVKKKSKRENQRVNKPSISDIQNTAVKLLHP